MIALSLLIVAQLSSGSLQSDDSEGKYGRVILAVPPDVRRVGLTPLEISKYSIPEKQASAVNEEFIGYRQGNVLSLVSRKLPRLESLYSRFALCAEVCRKLGDGRSPVPEAKIGCTEFSAESQIQLKKSITEGLFFNPDQDSFVKSSLMFVLAGQVQFRSDVGPVSVFQAFASDPKEKAMFESQYANHRTYSVIRANLKEPFDRSGLPELGSSTYRVVYPFEPNGRPDPALASSLADAIERVYSSEKRRLNSELLKVASKALGLTPNYFGETAQAGLSESQTQLYRSRVAQQLVGSGIPLKVAQRAAQSAVFENREYTIYFNIMFKNGVIEQTIGPASVTLWP